MPAQPDQLSLTITEYKKNYALFDDGARVSWDTHMVCTCVLAQRQDRAKNCCKHVVYLIRERKDKILTDKYIYIPVALPTTSKEDVWWVTVGIKNSVLFLQLLPTDTIFVSHVSEHICRLDARALVVPHLLGFVNQVKCRKCGGYPPAILNLLSDRTNQELQVDALREVCHWLQNKPLNLCIEHDDTDLVPF